MKKSVQLLWLFSLLILTSCTYNKLPELDLPSDRPYPNLSVDRTVLVYMVANNSLSDFASQNIQEMLAGLKALRSDLDPSNCNLLFFISSGNLINQTIDDGYYIDSAGKKKPKNKVVNKYPEPQLIKVDVQDGVVKEYIIERYKNGKALNEDFMSTVMKDAFNGQFKAKSNGLVLWSHADGWLPLGVTRLSSRSFGQDGNDFMDFISLKNALKKAPKLDFLLYDCCFMQSIEVAYELKDIADYFIGSPTEIPGPGAPYDKMVNVFYDTTDLANSEKVSENVAKTYFEHYVTSTGSNWPFGVSISTISSYLLDEIAKRTKDILSENKGSLEKPRASDLFYYDKSKEHYYYDMVDVMEKMLGANVGYLTQWKDLYNSAVKYRTTPTNYSVYIAGTFLMEGSTGVAMYYDANYLGSPEINKYYKKLAWYKDVMSVLDN